MNKRSALIALSLTAMLVACGKQEAAPSATSAAPAPAAISKIVVGLDDNFPPMGFRDEKNELVGFDIDMAREAAKRMGMEVDFKPIDWSAKEAELSAKRVDVLWNGLTITEERKKNIAFTAPYMENHQIVVVAATSPIKAKADLAGKVVGAQDGSSAPLSGLRFHSGGKPRASVSRASTRHWPASSSLARCTVRPASSGSSRGSQRAPGRSRRISGTSVGARRRSTARLAVELARPMISATDMQRNRFQYQPTWVRLGI